MKSLKRKSRVSRFIIIGNGEIDDIRFLKKFLRKDYLIIAADGGYNHIRKLHKKPNYLIGDMDSVRDLPKNSNSIRLIKYPKSKDRTDTEIAVEFAIKNKASEILLFGMTSLSRIDHSLNNIFLLQNIADKRIINTLFRSEEHTSELQSHSFISYAVFCLKKKKTNTI